MKGWLCNSLVRPVFEKKKCQGSSHENGLLYCTFMGMLSVQPQYLVLVRTCICLRRLQYESDEQLDLQ